LQQKSGLPVL